MYSSREQEASFQTAQCFDHSISDDDDVVDPHRPEMQSRHSSPDSLASPHREAASRHEQQENNMLDKTMTSSLSSSTFSSAASKRDSLYSLARTSTVASSINEQAAVGNFDMENKKRWSASSLTSLDDITMSPQKMSIVQLKSASAAITQNSLDPLTMPSQMDMRRSPVPNRSIMSVLNHGNENDPSTYHTHAPCHHEYEVRYDALSKTYSHSSSDNSTVISAGSNGRLSWTSTLNTTITMSGWLLKHNATHFTFTSPWKRYYYVLADHALHEYKTDKADSAHRDQFDFTSDTMVFVNEGFPGKSNVLEIRKPGRRMCLQCTDVDNMKQWMQYFKRSISQMKRNDSVKSTSRPLPARSGSHQNANDITVSLHPTSPPPLINGNMQQQQPNLNRTPSGSSTYRSHNAGWNSPSLSHISSNEIPPQLPPPSRSPPPVPDV